MEYWEAIGKPEIEEGSHFQGSKGLKGVLVLDSPFGRLGLFSEGSCYISSCGCCREELFVL